MVHLPCVQPSPCHFWDWPTSMAAEDLLINYGSDRQAVEAVSKGFPQFDVVAPLTCEEQEKW